MPSWRACSVRLGYRIGCFLEDSHSVRANYKDEVGGGAHDEGRRSPEDAPVNLKQSLYAQIAAIDPPELCKLLPDGHIDYSGARGNVSDALYSAGPAP
jgi:hypothetical protein